MGPTYQRQPSQIFPSPKRARTCDGEESVGGDLPRHDDNYNSKIEVSADDDPNRAEDSKGGGTASDIAYGEDSQMPSQDFYAWQWGHPGPIRQM